MTDVLAPTQWRCRCQDRLHLVHALAQLAYRFRWQAIKV